MRSRTTHRRGLQRKFLGELSWLRFYFRRAVAIPESVKRRRIIERFAASTKLVVAQLLPCHQVGNDNFFGRHQ